MGRAIMLRDAVDWARYTKDLHYDELHYVASAIRNSNICQDDISTLEIMAALQHVADIILQAKQEEQDEEACDR